MGAEKQLSVKLQEWSMDGFQSRPSRFPIPVQAVAGATIASRPFFYAVLSNLRNFLLMMVQSLPHFLGMFISLLWVEKMCLRPKHKLSPLVAVIV